MALGVSCSCSPHSRAKLDRMRTREVRLPGETGHWAEVVRKAPSALKYCQDAGSLTPQAAPILSPPPFFVSLLFKFVE